MTTYLRHTKTGDLYVFTSILAKRSDMELVEEADEVAESAPAKPPRTTGKGKGKGKSAKTESEPEEVVEEVPVADTDVLEDLETDPPLADEAGE